MAPGDILYIVWGPVTRARMQYKNKEEVFEEIEKY